MKSKGRWSHRVAGVTLCGFAACLAACGQPAVPTQADDDADGFSAPTAATIESNRAVAQAMPEDHLDGMDAARRGLIAEADDLVAAQYAGKKAALRPHYDALIAAVRGFGPDIEIAPKKAYVSLRRSKQFALIQPSTVSRMDLGLVLKGEEAGGMIEPFNAMCTHRIRLPVDTPIPDEALAALKRAYDAA